MTFSFASLVMNALEVRGDFGVWLLTGLRSGEEGQLCKSTTNKMLSHGEFSALSRAAVNRELGGLSVRISCRRRPLGCWTDSIGNPQRVQ